MPPKLIVRDDSKKVFNRPQLEMLISLLIKIIEIYDEYYDTYAAHESYNHASSGYSPPTEILIGKRIGMDISGMREADDHVSFRFQYDKWREDSIYDMPLDAVKDALNELYKFVKPIIGRRNRVDITFDDEGNWKLYVNKPEPWTW